MNVIQLIIGELAAAILGGTSEVHHDGGPIQFYTKS